MRKPSIEWLGRYGHCQDLQEIIKAARRDFPSNKVDARILQEKTDFIRSKRVEYLNKKKGW